MPRFEARVFSISALLRCFAEILDELKERGVVRTQNNPVADYAEWLVAKKLGLSLEPNSKYGYDATSKSSTRYQIKSRRLHPSNKSRQLSVIRNLDTGEFDYLIGVIFNQDFTVKEGYKIPHGLIVKYARFSKHQNGFILNLKGDVLNAKGVKDITHILKGKRRRVR